MIKVELLGYTEEPEKKVAHAARLCYSEISINDLKNTITEKYAAKMVRKLLKLNHLSVLEHASFMFGVEGISRVTSHQLVRHRIATFSQQSQRYVCLQDTFNYTVPPTIRKHEQMLEKYHAIIADIKSVYDEFIAAGISEEDARFILPNATETKMIISMNARALLNFFSLRLCLRSQEEIRIVAQQMLAKVKKVAPVIFEKCGPPCEEKGICTENNPTCPRYPKKQKS